MVKPVYLLDRRVGFDPRLMNALKDMVVRKRGEVYNILDARKDCIGCVGQGGDRSLEVQQALLDIPCQKIFADIPIQIRFKALQFLINLLECQLVLLQKVLEKLDKW